MLLHVRGLTIELYQPSYEMPQYWLYARLIWKVTAVRIIDFRMNVYFCNIATYCTTQIGVLAAMFSEKVFTAQGFHQQDRHVSGQLASTKG